MVAAIFPVLITPPPRLSANYHLTKPTNYSATSAEPRPGVSYPKRDPPGWNTAGSTASLATMALKVERIPTLGDNYTYLVICGDTGEAAVVDAPEADPVIRRVNKLGVQV